MIITTNYPGDVTIETVESYDLSNFTSVENVKTIYTDYLRFKLGKASYKLKVDSLQTHLIMAKKLRLKALYTKLQELINLLSKSY